jgi:SAM-dependent methyltransferase
MALPFPDGSFELVFCQQMLQFVPDRLAALREARRVLARGGRLFMSSWRARSEQPFHEALGRIAERHLGASRDARWSLGAAELGHAVAEAGFTDIRIDSVSLGECFREVPLRLNAMAAGFDLGALSDAERERRLAAIEADSVEVLTRFAQSEGVGAPSVTNIVTAVAP